jgi:hypothetical protein
MRCSFDCVDRVLKRTFCALGTHIGTHPGYYIIGRSTELFPNS